MTLEKIVPNNICFNAAISSCEEEGQWQRALQLLGAMYEALVPDVFSFSSVMSSFEKAGEWQQALHLLQEMGDISERSDMQTIGKRPSRPIANLIQSHDSRSSRKRSPFVQV